MGRLLPFNNCKLIVDEIVFFFVMRGVDFPFFSLAYKMGQRIIFVFYKKKKSINGVHGFMSEKKIEKILGR